MKLKILAAKIYYDTLAVIVIVSVFRRKHLTVLSGVLSVVSFGRAMIPTAEKVFVYARERISYWYVLVVFKILDCQIVAEVSMRNPCLYFIK